jgi:predicted metal-dependent hydrolase
VSQDQLPFDEPPPVPPPRPSSVPFEVVVTRSKKRRRTVGAQLKDGVLHIAIPSWMSKAEEAHWREEMTSRFRRRMTAERIDLRERSTTLARRYDLPRPTEIRWADDMATRWGSCTPGAGTIRLSSRLAGFPNWVLDYVIVHELAHLSVSGHGPEFWQLVQRYPRAERAIGFLIAKSHEPSDDEVPETGDVD